MRPSIAVEDAVQTLGANIRNARHRRRLPQSVVAERAGVSLNTLSKVENGGCVFSIGNIASILIPTISLLPLLSSLASSENDDAGLLMEEKFFLFLSFQKKKPSLSS
ncbi:MAG: helix-turn-helix transcriptional regulator [Sutterella seckii]